jgi:hypothetical protein
MTHQVPLVLFFVIIGMADDSYAKTLPADVGHAYHAYNRCDGAGVESKKLALTMSMSKASIDLCGEDDPVVTFDPNATQDTLVIYNENWRDYNAAVKELMTSWRRSRAPPTPVSTRTRSKRRRS